MVANLIRLLMATARRLVHLLQRHMSILLHEMRKQRLRVQPQKMQTNIRRKTERVEGRLRMF